MNVTKTHATGRIAVKTFDTQPWNEVEGGPQLNRVYITETFTGDVEAEAEVTFVQALRADRKASFCGIERVQGVLGGRTGTFLLQDEGGVDGDRGWGRWFVVPGSGTGELAGLRGEGGFDFDLGKGADFTLDYWYE